MKLPRIRILRHWSVSEPIERGYWLLCVEPRWPILKFETLEFGNELPFPPRDDYSFDIVVEHFEEKGSCGKQIWAVDLSSIVKRLRRTICAN